MELENNFGYYETEDGNVICLDEVRILYAPTKELYYKRLGNSCCKLTTSDFNKIKKILLRK